MKSKGSKKDYILVQIEMPHAFLEELEKLAHKNQRNLHTEFIERLRLTCQKDYIVENILEKYRSELEASLQRGLKTNHLVSALMEEEVLDYRQLVPKEIMSCLEEIAHSKGVDLYLEIIMRLLATMLDSKAFEFEEEESCENSDDFPYVSWSAAIGEFQIEEKGKFHSITMH